MSLRTLLALALTLVPATARAHEGPPFPVVVDQQAGPYRLSVWADPDVGTGTFFITFDPPARRSPSDPRVAVEVWPVSGRLAPRRSEARPQPDDAYRAEVRFDREETWHVRVAVDGSRGAGERTFDVAVTPPGYGRWDLLIYLTPFLLLGGLWVAVAVRRRKL